MKYFNQDFIDFFSELSKNNNRDWFNENKQRYIKSVKEPFYYFIEELIQQIHDDDETINITPKEAIFRIYKDVRFSKDKLPYKVFTSAIISPGGRKDFTTPGYYIEMDYNGVRFYGGAHFLDKDQLQNLREHIASNLNEFKRLHGEKMFKKKFGTLLGEQNKRIPKEFKEIIEKEPLIANKQFYYSTELSPNKILSNTLMDTIIKLYFVGKPVNQFLVEGIRY
ncbi:hypothetical protein MNBD_IGNAVI01-1618 [hydrothermal vent metagenome]|uniref:TIGR02453 family protein n=1 Tax=hydrothermal vent metagenome TaxID=652676 RepID=A0A3B1D134_9ZZZZ